MNNHNDYVLQVEGLKTHFFTDDGRLPAVDGVTFSVKRGQILALVGESGCGKSVTAYSILRLIQKPGKVVDGKVTLFPPEGDAIDITSLGDKSETLFKVRGGLISMIFQEPMTALSPVHSIGNQIGEAIHLHQEVTQKEATQRIIEMLTKVGIPNPETRLHQYPHELSGGMRQRVMIAMALVCKPVLLIADEPTTALDVTIQAQIMGLMKSLQQQMNTSILLITHDLGVVSQIADEVAVMYLGRIVEQTDIRTLMQQPRHPYTMALLQSLPSLSQKRQRLESIEGSVPLLTEIPAGCSFHPRCRFVQGGRCDDGGLPQLQEISSGHKVACVRAEEIP